MSIYSFLRPIGWLWMRIFYPFKVYGKENIVNDGNTVVICNHLSTIDVPIVALIYKNKTYFLAKKEWYNKKFRSWFFDKMGGIPVDRDHVDMESAKKCLTVLKKGGRLCVFPEGTRNKNGTELMPFHGGAGVFAFRSKSQIQPVIIEKKPKIFKKTRVYVGKTFDFSDFYDKKSDADLNEKLTRKMFFEMQNAQKTFFEILKAEKDKKRGKKNKKAKNGKNDKQGENHADNNK